MKLLILHALKTEASTLRQHFPQATTPVCASGIELRALSEDIHLLRTGLGLDRTAKNLDLLEDPQSIYGGVVQIGVSGALDARLEAFQMVYGHSFQNEAHVSLPKSFQIPCLEKVTKPLNFISTREAIFSEAQRAPLIAQGAQAVDMESFAAAEFCHRLQLPFFSLRCISDHADGDGEMDFKANFKAASQKPQALLLDHLDTILAQIA